jgi:uracil-DNA glycosylase
MGYYYLGGGNSGDMPPRGEYAALWLDHLLADRRKSSLAETAKAWWEYAPQYIPLPHPSPRNQPWFKRHAWFEEQLIPMPQTRIKTILAC